MKLLLDIGNSRCKWAQFVDDQLIEPGERVHEGDFSTCLEKILDSISAPPDAVLAASVAGSAVAAQLTQAVEARWQMPVQFAETEVSTGALRNGYRDHRQMGVDRWLAVVAAHQQYRCALCVVDAGTAVTIDLVAEDGQHLGGFIVPGLDLMRRSLFQDTGDIRGMTQEHPGPASRELETPARDTLGAIRSGSVLAVACLVEHCMELLPATSSETRLIVTGGDADRILPRLAIKGTHHPLLVLEGLAARLA
jgi:type III pantothenate kinase